MKKEWIKINIKGWLDGSIRVDLTAEERSVWADILALAGYSRDEGKLQRGEGVPYTALDLSERFKVPIEVVESTINKCMKEGRITLTDSGIWEITHWWDYQARSPQQRLPETEVERNLRELREQQRLNRRHPDTAPVVTKVVDKDGVLIHETKIEAIDLKKSVPQINKKRAKV